MLKSTEKSGGPLSHPKEFDELLNGKQMLFKVELINVAINGFEYFNVIDICDDVSIISKFKDLNPVFISVQADVSVGLSPGKNSLSMGFNDVGPSSVSNIDESEIIPPGFTPAKRSSEENIEEGDMSSTKMKMKAVKVEKD